MGVEAEDFIGQAEFLIRYIKNGAPVPEWISGQALSKEAVEDLSPVQQIGHTISREIYERYGASVKCGTLEWRKRFSQRMNEVLADYSWLS